MCLYRISIPSFQQKNEENMWKSVFARKAGTVLKHYPSTRSNTCGGPVLWHFLDDKSQTLIPNGCRIVFGFFFASGCGIFCWLSFPVPFALYLQQFGTRTCHFEWYLLHFGMVILHGICYIWPCSPSICMVFVTFWHFNLWFPWYLLHFGASNVHVGLLSVL